MRRLLVAASLVLLVACDNSGVLLGPGGGRFQLDDGAVTDAELLVPYSARLAVVAYEGVPSWDVIGGELPPGLGLATDGAISGTPTWMGSYEFEVRVTGELLGQLTGTVGLDVLAGATDVQMGWTRDQTTGLTDTQDLMWDPWTRLAGAGEDQATVSLDLGLYTTGLDGVHRQGAGDDVRVGDLEPGDVSVLLGAWQPVGDQPIEDDPMEYAGDLTFVAGSDTGSLPFTLEHPDYESVNSRVMVTPPDWCPTGEHGGGGSPGACS